jgi:nicotinamidase-related amidase
MIASIIRLTRRRVIVDVDTQRDFFLAEGMACIRNHRRVLANIRRMMAWARTYNIRIISTAQIYRNGNGNSDKGHWCIEGTEGIRKINYTLVNRRKSYAADGYTDFSKEVFKENDQLILFKRCPDPFSEPRAERVLTELKADEFIIIGAAVEDAVKATVLGLLQRNKKVTIVVDAVGSHDKHAAELAFRQMQAKGARLVETRSLAGLSHLKRVGICGCDRCKGLLDKLPEEQPIKIPVKIKTQLS